MRNLCGCNDPVVTGWKGFENFDKKSYVDEYIKRSMLIGRRIYIVNGDDKIPVTAKEIDRDCRLKVEYEDGSEIRHLV